jgi:biotin carboxylase
MRERIQNYEPKINPKYKIISKNTKQEIQSLIDYIGFPLIVKPSGLAASRLVSICYHKEELEAALKNIFKNVETIHKKTGGTWESKILVEQFMEGTMYSMDVYVSESGKLFYCPMIYVKTGRAIGFDDFFGYEQMTAAKLHKDAIAQAEWAAATAIRAMALRSTTVHIEFIRMEDGWKIIEMGPRAGGFRHMLYAYSHGINHTMNDILIRTKKKPILPKTQLGWSVAMKFFAKTEGKMKALNGIKKAQNLSSFKVVYIHKKVGESCTYAKHGGSSVFDIIMFNKDRSELLADIRRLEKMIEIVVE